MKILSINLKNFRNYASLNVEFNSIINIIYGNNAQGKTNLLEAIYYMAFGFTYRTRSEEELIKFGATDFSTDINFSNKFYKNKIIIKKYLKNGKYKKELTFNNNVLKAKEHYGLLNVVLFSPDDLQIVKGEPGLRRKFINLEIAQTDKYYYNLLVKYNKTMLQRNKFLKDSKEKINIDFTQLLVWDSELAKIAAEIIIIRLETLKRISEISADVYNKLTLSKENLNLSYILKTSDGETSKISSKTQKEWEEWYLKEFKMRRNLDVIRCSTSIGPHRDDILINVDDNNLRAFGSQGQQRSAALALKLAELEFIKEVKEEYPVLLLDDVMSELDSGRRKQLLTFIDGKVQTFITVNDKELVKYLPDSKYFYVENGNMYEE
ncbi:MAG: DNA replication/repair protein RecF [Acidaminococcaceae bacterium]|nr:DNA replication/repair protein RecF [Acidaminococcaceae bacterium]